MALWRSLSSTTGADRTPVGRRAGLVALPCETMRGPLSTCSSYAPGPKASKRLSETFLAFRSLTSTSLSSHPSYPIRVSWMSHLSRGLVSGCRASTPASVHTSCLPEILFGGTQFSSFLVYGTRVPPRYFRPPGLFPLFPIKLCNSRARYHLRPGHQRDIAKLPFVCLRVSCPTCLPCPVLHGSEGSAWARTLGVPLSDLRLLCGSIDDWGGESRNVHPKFYT